MRSCALKVVYCIQLCTLSAKTLPSIISSAPQDNVKIKCILLQQPVTDSLKTFSAAPIVVPSMYGEHYINCIIHQVPTLIYFKQSVIFSSVDLPPPRVTLREG